MTSRKNNYKVYVHVFPDGKRYVGCTCRPVRERWNGGLGYEEQPVFDAIMRYGWNNIRHYILMDNLTQDEALLYESAFIHSWKTYTKSKGYNVLSIKVKGADDINIPTFQSCKKQKVDDFYSDDILLRYKERYSSGKNRKTKPVRCIETGEIFLSADKAAIECGVPNGNYIRKAIKRGYSCGEYNGAAGSSH